MNEFGGVVKKNNPLSQQEQQQKAYFCILRLTVIIQ